MITGFFRVAVKIEGSNDSFEERAVGLLIKEVEEKIRKSLEEGMPGMIKEIEVDFGHLGKDDK